MEKTLKNFKRVAKIMEEKHAILKFKLVIHVFCLLCPESYYKWKMSFEERIHGCLESASN